MTATNLKCELECPQCHEVWGILKFKYGSMVKAGDVTVLKANKKFKKNDTLACTSCGFQYSNWDVVLAIAKKPSKSPIPNEIADITPTYTPHRRGKSK